MTEGAEPDDPWSRARAGDQDAQHEVFRVGQRVAREMAWRWRLTEDVAEAVHSRLRVCLWERMTQGGNEPTSSLSGWLSGLWRGCFTDYQRERRREQRARAVAEEILRSLDSDRRTSQEPHEVDPVVLYCLNQLPKNQRLALELRHIDQLSPTQGAAKMGNVSPDTFRVWVHRGSLALKECLRRRNVR